MGWLSSETERRRGGFGSSDNARSVGMVVVVLICVWLLLLCRKGRSISMGRYVQIIIGLGTGCILSRKPLDFGDQ